VSVKWLSNGLIYCSFWVQNGQQFVYEITIFFFCETTGVRNDSNQMEDQLYFSAKFSATQWLWLVGYI